MIDADEARSRGLSVARGIVVGAFVGFGLWAFATLLGLTIARYL